MTPPPAVLLCTDTFADQFAARLDDPRIDVVALGPSDELPAGELARVTVAFLSKDAFPLRFEALLQAAGMSPNLVWLHVMSAGVDSPVFDPFRNRGVLVTRTPGASATAIAETVFMYLHALTRDVRTLADRQSRRSWEWEQWRPLERRRILVLGYGPIGQQVIRVAQAYGMEPTVLRRRVRGDELCRAAPLDRLSDEVADADVIVVALPLTAETRGLVSADVIGRCAASAILVNVARGPIVDQRALTEAVAAGRIAAAGLDVFDEEPLPADDPLWTLPNVIVTPHNAGSSTLGPAKVAEVFFDHLAEYLDDPAAFAAEQRADAAH